MSLPGLWTMSYSGWMRLLPWPALEPGEKEEDLIAKSKGVPPMIVAHRWNPPLGDNNSWFEESDGFVPFSTLMLIKFDESGGLTGEFQNNQAAERVQTFEMTGVYEISKHPKFNVFRGFFRTTNRNRQNYIADHRYDFLMTSADEIEFHWTGGSHLITKQTEFGEETTPGEGAFLPRIARGTLKRVTLAPA